MIRIKSSASGEVLCVAIWCEEVIGGESEASQNTEAGVPSSLLEKKNEIREVLPSSVFSLCPFVAGNISLSANNSGQLFR